MKKFWKIMSEAGSGKRKKQANKEKIRNIRTLLLFRVAEYSEI